MQREAVLLTTAYFPPVEYFVAVARAAETYVESCEMYQKQSYRTRCIIYSSEGPFPLNIPILRTGGDHSHKIPIKDVKIDYSENWIQAHLRALEAAYMNTPFFEYYKDEIFSVINSRPEYLIDLNMRLMQLLLSFMEGLGAKLCCTTEFVAPHSASAPYTELPLCDLRERIQPKYKGVSYLKELNMEKPYYQIFSGKYGFIPNLSILDLLFHEGPNAISYLR